MSGGRKDPLSTSQRTLKDVNVWNETPAISVERVLEAMEWHAVA